MFCLHCGKPVGENDRFCAYCGGEVDFKFYQGGRQGSEPGKVAESNKEDYGYDAGSGQEKVYGSGPAPEEGYGYGSGSVPKEAYGFEGTDACRSPEGFAGYGGAAFSVTDAVRRLGSSPLFFAGIILAAACAVLEFISALSGIQEYAMFFGADSASSIAAGVTAGGVAGLIMAAVSITGMIMFYAACKYGESSKIKTKGLSVVRVMAVIECVLMIVFSVLVLAAGILMAVVLSMFGSGLGEDEVIGAGIIVVVIIVLLIILVFVNIFYIKLVKTIKSILNTAGAGIITGNISLYVIVFLFILAFAGLAVQIPAAVGFVSVICALAGAAENVIFAVILIKYRKMY